MFMNLKREELDPQLDYLLRYQYAIELLERWYEESKEDNAELSKCCIDGLKHNYDTAYDLFKDNGGDIAKKALKPTLLGGENFFKVEYE